MSNDDSGKTGDVFPPARGPARPHQQLPEMRLPLPPEGSSYINRIRWRIARRNVEEYNKMIQEVERGIRGLGDLRKAELYYEECITMLEDSEKIHATARMKREIAFINTREELEDARLKSEERERERARRRHTLATEPEPEAPKKPWEQRISKLQERMQAEREMRAWFASVKEQEIRKAGGEERLSAAQRKMLEDLEMYLEDEITKMREGQE